MMNSYQSRLRKLLAADGRTVGRKARARARHKSIMVFEFHEDQMGVYVQSWLVTGEHDHIVKLVDGRWRCFPANGNADHIRHENRLCSHEYAVYRNVAYLSKKQTNRE